MTLNKDTMASLKKMRENKEKLSTQIVIDKFDLTKGEANDYLRQLMADEKKAKEKDDFLDTILTETVKRTTTPAVKSEPAVKAKKTRFFMNPETNQPIKLRVAKETNTAIIYEPDVPRLVNIYVAGSLMTVNETEVNNTRAAGKSTYKGQPLALVEAAMKLALG